MDKVFIQGLVQLQCKRFRERREEGRERGIEGGREGEGKRKRRKEGERKSHTAVLLGDLFSNTIQHSQETAV